MRSVIEGKLDFIAGALVVILAMVAMLGLIVIWK